MMEITRMNQTCPHCQALVILPELVRNYGDMPIQCHDCESSFFFANGPIKQISAPLRFVCPNCTSPLPTRPWRRLPGWRGILLAVCIGLFIGAVEFQLEPASLVTLKVALMTTQTILIDFFDGIQS
jgi:hypothetical protein